MKVYLKVISLLLLPVLIVGQPENPYLRSLHRSLSEATSDTIQMNVFSRLGSYYLSEDRDSANFYLEKALPIAVKLNLKLDEASILNKMGIILMQQEKFSQSLEYYLKSLHIAKDPAIEKTIWNLSTGQSPESARLLEVSNSYDLIGLLNAYTGNWIDNIQNQLKNYREAETYAKAAGDSGQIAYVNFHIGIAYMNGGRSDSALLLINDALSTFSELNDTVGMGRALKYLGDTYERMGNFDVAANHILQSISLLKETNDYVHLGLAYISLNRVYTGQKKYDSAFHYAKESLIIFEKRRDPVRKKDAYNLLAAYFDQMGITDSATVYLKLAKSLSDSLSEEARKNLLAFQDVVVGEQVKLEKMEKEKIRTKGRIRTYSMISGLVILSLIGLILYRNNRKEKKAKIILEKTLKELKSTQSQLIQSEKMASLGELTAGIAHEIQNPLNFVNNFSEVSNELITEMVDEVNKGNTNEVKAIAADVKQNLEKILHHGKRADAIVKGMMQHSRSNSGQKEPSDINALAGEYLRLAYHGLRAKDKSFNVSLITEFDESVGSINIIPQDIGRVILNLVSNAFYAVQEKLKRDDQHFKPNYKPLVIVRTQNFGDNIVISVKDNGIGIPDSIKEKIFQPFFTTRPTGQGTGLGLSLSYDIVKAHGGELEVETKEDDGTTFFVRLPVQ